MTYSIVIVDDDTLIAELLADAIQNFEHFNVLYTVQNGKALVERFKQLNNIPDVVLLDIGMPLMDGYETAGWLKKHYPDIHILALTAVDNEHSLIRMIREGAGGYLVKNVKRPVLENALNTLVETGMYIPDWSKKNLLKNLAKGDLFTERELKLFRYLATDLTYEQIGKEMYFARATIEADKNMMCKKVEVNSRVGLVAWAYNNGFL